MLPIFRYFPDPIAMGSIIESPNECECCGESRGFVIADVVYADGDYCEKICPWCVADGRAAVLMGGEFNCREGVGGNGAWDDVTGSIKDEVATRTPGFLAIQDNQWFTHCSDAAEFHGFVTKEQLVSMGPKVVSQFLESLGEDTYEDFVEFGSTELMDLIREGVGRGKGYLFKCKHCGCHGGYVDYC